MISKFEEFNSLFEEIDKETNVKINVFVIGGAMLLYHGLKPATKDIDLIVNHKLEFVELEKILHKKGFKAKKPTFEYSKLELNQMFSRDNFRVDLFEKKVCNGFSISDTMIKRAQLILSLAHINVYLCSKEDVFIFKTFTEREGDIEDCISLASKGLDWEAILNELKIQTKDHSVWITYTAGRLELLEEKGLSIPIMNKVSLLVDNYYTELEKRTGQ